MDGHLSNKLKNFVDDPEKLFRQGRREARSRKLGIVDPNTGDEGTSESPPTSPKKESPPTSLRDQPQPPPMAQERKIGELCIPELGDLPILNLADIGRPFEIKTSTIRMVQHTPFTGKEDPNLHIQAFIQLCQTFTMEGLDQNQLRARFFPFSLLGKALQWFYTLPWRRCKIGKH